MGAAESAEQYPRSNTHGRNEVYFESNASIASIDASAFLIEKQDMARSGCNADVRAFRSPSDVVAEELANADHRLQGLGWMQPSRGAQRLLVSAARAMIQRLKACHFPGRPHAQRDGSYPRVLLMRGGQLKRQCRTVDIFASFSLAGENFSPTCVSHDCTRARRTRCHGTRSPHGNGAISRNLNVH